MAVTTDVGVVNIAMIRLGHDPIDFLSGISPEEVAANTIYEPIRDKMLEALPWDFQVQEYTREIDDEQKTVTAITQADPAVVTVASHGYKNGMHVTFEDLAGMTELDEDQYRIASVATNTFELEGVDSSAYTAFSSGSVRVRPPHRYEYAYALPSDYLRMWRMYPTDENYEVRRKFLYCNWDEIYIEYLAKITTVSEWDPTFVMALAAAVAVPLSKKIGDTTIELVQELKDEAKKALLTAQETCALESEPYDLEYFTAWQER